jgi:L-seryl-tRNA(Ser) seleniumtransferase/D-glucosaminate-6-phosphate ammonia-lyase
MTIYRRLGLREVINARGYTSAFGSAVMAEEVVKAMAEAASAHVLMDELLDRASEVIAEATGAEAGCVTAGAAAGIAVSVAACMTGTDILKIEQLPDTNAFRRNEVVLQRAHLSKYVLMIQMTGAKLTPVGYIGVPSWTSAEHLVGVISDRTAALFFLLSEARHVHGELDLRTFIEVGHEKDVPIIVDAAGMPDMRQYIDMGADLVIYSGGKYLLGPGSSGVIAGRAELIRACRLQEWGIARSMKVSKEEVAGLIAALLRYGRIDQSRVWNGWHELASALQESIRTIPNTEVRILNHDYAGDPAVIVQLSFDEKVVRRTAANVHQALARGNPAIQLRDARQGVLEMDMRELTADQVPVLSARLMEELASSSTARGSGD